MNIVKQSINLVRSTAVTNQRKAELFSSIEDQLSLKGSPKTFNDSINAFRGMIGNGNSNYSNQAKKLEKALLNYFKKIFTGLEAVTFDDKNQMKVTDKEAVISFLANGSGEILKQQREEAKKAKQAEENKKVQDAINQEKADSVKQAEENPFIHILEVIAIGGDNLKADEIDRLVKSLNALKVVHEVEQVQQVA